MQVSTNAVAYAYTIVYLGQTEMQNEPALE